MKKLMKAPGAVPLLLTARTAADLMTPDPVSIEAGAPLKEAAVLLTERGFSAAPVIDEAGRPLGVLSRTDLVNYDRQKEEHVEAGRDYYNEQDRISTAGEPLRGGFQVVDVDRTQVRDIMTPLVYSVPLDTPAGQVIQEMIERKVHRVFVVDEDGVLVGVVSAMDVLRRLEPA